MIRTVLALGAALLTVGQAVAAERVVTLAPHLAELVAEAGALDQLVGVSRFTDHPPQAAALPKVGDGFAIRHEHVLALRPTLVLAWAGGTPDAAVRQLRGLGLRVESLTVGSLDDIPAAVRTLGQLLDVQATADAAASRLAQRIAGLKGGSGQPLRVYYQVSASPIYTLNGQSIVSDAIARCGGRNVFAELPTIAPLLGRESVVMAQPEVILYSTPGGDAIWQGFDVIPAVATGRVYKINPDLLARPGPRFVDGAEMLCAILRH